MTRKTGTLH